MKNNFEEELYHSLLNKQPEEEKKDILEEVDWEKIQNIFLRTLPWMVLIPLLFLTGSYLYLRYTKSIYESSSIFKLQLKNETNNFIDLKNVKSNENDLVGEIEFIKSKLIYDEVLKRLDLTVSYYIEGNVLDDERYKTSPFQIKYTLHNPNFYNQKIYVKILDKQNFILSYNIEGEKFYKEGKFNTPLKTRNFDITVQLTTNVLTQDNFYVIINTEATLINYLATHLKAYIVNQMANTIGISFTDHNRFKAQDIVKTIGDVYLTQTLENKNKANKQKIKFLDELIKNTEENLQIYEAELEKFIIANKTDNIGSKVSEAIEKIGKLVEKRVELQTELRTLLAAQRLLNQDQDNQQILFFLPHITDAQISNFINEINKLQQEYEQLALSYKENTFALKSKKQQIQTLKDKVNQIITFFKQDTSQKIGEIQQQISDIEATFLGLPAKSTEFNKIKRLYGIYEGYYLQMLNSKTEIGIAEAGIVPEFVVLSAANLPEDPISPNKWGIYLASGAAGIFISLLLVAIRYLINNTISTQKELEKLTAVPILGAIPNYTDDEMIFSRLIVDKKPKSFISEAFRSVRTNLEFMLPPSTDNNVRYAKKIISITSTVSGEGKTFLAMNLGGIIAMSNLKVILLDLDMRRPKIHLGFDKDNHKGISTILIGKHTIEECIKKTSLDNLNIISAGPVPPNPSELIIRKEFDNLLADLQNLYDVIIVDTPPVGLVTDGILIMQKTDLQLYVVRATYSQKAFVKNINRLVKNKIFMHLGIIFNSAKKFQQYGGYGSGKYGHYYEDVATEESLWMKITNFIKNLFKKNE